MNVYKRFTVSVVEEIKNIITESNNMEVLFLGKLDSSGFVVEVEVGARGKEDTVPAIFPHMLRSDVVIHNHPSGILTPSGADLNIASLLGQEGIGFYIIDNSVEQVYPVVEPIEIKEKTNLDPLRDVLEPNGPLSNIYSGYEFRKSQADLLEDVVNALNYDSILIAEAGTGVGKSLAYLIPCLKWAEVNSERVVISTGTINLQEQLIEKDIPLAKKVLGSKVKTVLVKGRGNYICHKRLFHELEENSLFKDNQNDLKTIKEWIEDTKTGSISDLSFKPQNDLWASICSEGETCSGIRCNYFNQCFSMKAKKEASSAGVIVVNHHLLFADLAMRIEGVGYENSAILPPFSKIVFDEAHNIEDSATSFFSKRYNKFSLYKTLNRLLGSRAGKKYGSLIYLDKIAGANVSIAKVPDLIQKIREDAEVLDTLCQDFTGAKSYRVEGEISEKNRIGIFEPSLKLQKSILELTKEIGDILKGVDEDFHGVDSFIETRRYKSILEGYSSFFETYRNYLEYDKDVFWLDSAKTSKGEVFVNYSITPLDISRTMHQAVYEPYSSVIMTSATLTVSNNFNYWKRRVGFQYVDPDRVVEKMYISPFDYRNRVHLSIPRDMPLPTEDEYSEELTKYIIDILTETKGSGLVLFTSYVLLQEVYTKVKDIFDINGITCYRQGDDDRSRLLNNFNKDVSSILFATESFWEGVDSPGDTLKVVIITKLPFRVPTDPIIKARMEYCQEHGGNSFMDISVPDAVTRLKQGFGRLMRRKMDWGMVYILDSRVVKKQYGGIFIKSLPSCNYFSGNKVETISRLSDFLINGVRDE